MKRLKLLHLCIVLIAVITLSACSSTDKNALPVPVNAAVVVHVNIKSITNKLSWEEISKTNWFGRMRSETTDTLALQILQNPESSGIDMKDELVFFGNRLQSETGYFALAGRLKDVAAFEAFNKKLTKTNASPVKTGEFTSLEIDKKTMATWSGDKFVYILEAGTPRRSFEDDSSSTDVYAEPDLATAEQLAGYAKNLFGLKGDSLLVTDDRYAALIKQDGDIHLWSNAEANMSGARNFLPFALDTYLKSTVSASTVSFENGKIVMHAKVYSNKDMTNLMKKYEGSNLDKNLLQRLPSDNVVAVIAMNYKPEGLKEFLRLGSLDGMVNGVLADAGITLDDFIKANKGDLVFAATDLTVKETRVNLGPDMSDTTLTINKPDITFLLATTIGDKAAFNKLLETGKRIEKSFQKMGPVYYNSNNELFAIGNNQQKVDEFLKGGSKDHAFISRISGHPIGVYLDLKKLTAMNKLRPAMPGDSTAMEPLPQIWDDITATGGEFKDGGMVQEIEINMLDKNTNSLKQLSAYADKMSMRNKRGF